MAARLLQSVWPRPTREPQLIAPDLYGPVMVLLTLVAVLLFGMKSGGLVLTRYEGTLMGTAFAAAAGYWMGTGALLYSLAFIFNATLTVVETLSLLVWLRPFLVGDLALPRPNNTSLVCIQGYGMAPYCVVLGACSLFGCSTGSFHVLWLIVGGLAAARVALCLRSRTADAKQGACAAPRPQP